MDREKLIGKKVIHSSGKAGTIIGNVKDCVLVAFKEGERKKFQYPLSFASHLKMLDPDIQNEIKKDLRSIENKAAISVVRVDPVKRVSVKKPATSTAKRTTSRVEVPEQIKGVLTLGRAFTTHAEALNRCFGFRYKQYQQAYKSINDEYAVWFPNIATKIGKDYVSTDNYFGWINTLTDEGRVLTQIDRTPFDGNYDDKRHDNPKRIVFARFDGERVYRFIGVFDGGRRVQNGYEHWRIATEINTTAVRIY